MRLASPRSVRSRVRSRLPFFEQLPVPNVAAWFRAERLITRNVAAVSAWGDWSMKTGGVTQAVGADQPAWTPTVDDLSGLPAVAFSGDFLSNLTVTTDGIGLTSFHVMKMDKTYAAYHNVYEDPTPNVPQIWIQPDDDLEVNGVTGVVSAVSDAWHIVIAVHRDTGTPTTELYVDGARLGTASPALAIGASQALTQFNRTGTAATYYRGSVAEYGFYGRALSEFGIRLLTVFFGQRYGILVTR